MRNIESLLNSYLRYCNNEEEYLEKFKEPLSNLVEKINESLLSLSINDLTNLYMKYSDIDLINKEKNVKVLNLLYNFLEMKFENTSFLELLNIFSEVFVEYINIETKLIPINNRIGVYDEYIKDDSYLNYAMNRQHKSKEELIKVYREEIQNWSEIKGKYDFKFYHLERLYFCMQIFLEDKLNHLKFEEITPIQYEINEIVDKILEQILRMNEKTFDDKYQHEVISLCNKLVPNHNYLAFLEEIKKSRTIK